MNSKGDKKSKRPAKQTSNKPKLPRRRTIEDTILEGREYLIRSKMDAEYIPDIPDFSPVIKQQPKSKVKVEESEPVKRPRKDSDYDTPKKIKKTKEVNIQLYVSENIEGEPKRYKVIDGTNDIEKRKELLKKPLEVKEEPVKSLNEDFEAEKIEQKYEALAISQNIPDQEIKDGTDEMDIEKTDTESINAESIVSISIIKEFTYQIISRPICEYASLSQTKSLTCIQKPLTSLLEIKIFSIFNPPKINTISLTSHFTSTFSLCKMPLVSPTIIIESKSSNFSASTKPYIELFSITEEILNETTEIKQVHLPIIMEKEIPIAQESTDTNFYMKNEENLEEMIENELPMKRSRSFDTCIEDCPRKELKVEESCLKENFHDINEDDPEIINSGQETRNSQDNAEIIEFDMERFNVKFRQFKLLSKPRLQIEVHKSMVSREKVPICFASLCYFRVLPELHGFKMA